MISSITNQGKVRFMLYREAMTSPVLIRFLSRLIKDVDRKVFLILDNHRFHHSKVLRKWLSEQQDQIEVFFCLRIRRNTIRRNTTRMNT